jgi:hypothetical protein
MSHHFGRREKGYLFQGSIVCKMTLPVESTKRNKGCGWVKKSAEHNKAKELKAGTNVPKEYLISIQTAN